MTEKEKYALEWNNSAQYFYNKNNYAHLSEQIQNYKTILEIGCGTGQSTLALLESGHAVIAVDINSHCIEKAKQLVKGSGYTITEDMSNMSQQTVCFIECDVTDSSFEKNVLPHISPDAVICWNMGSYWDKEKVIEVFPKLVEYGLTPQQILGNVESSYVELILWHACVIAKAKKCAVHIVDRGTHEITQFNDPYYSLLKTSLSFRNIEYFNITASSLSKGGRQLIANGEVNTQHEIPIVFVSILLT